MEKEQDNSYHKINLNWYPGHMAKTRKQIIEDLKLIDVVVEILDARIPISSMNKDLEQYIESKKRIVVLNKTDLADENVTKKWISKFGKNNIKAVAIEANNKKGVTEVVNTIKTESKDIMKKYAEKGRVGRKIKVMVLGIPNVGKSTFINSLSKKKVAKVENRPGVTKQKQWIKIDDNIELMDTPGMLWPKLENEQIQLNLAFTNSISKNAIDNEEVAYYLLQFLIENYPARISERYDVNKEELEQLQTIDVLEKIARKKGCLLSGGRIDETKVSNLILNEYQSGKLGRISLEKPQSNNE